MGRIFDDRGNRMTPSHARKDGKRYRYYLSSALSQGRAEHAGSVRRIPAPEIETLIIDAVRKRLKEPTPATDHDLINTNVGRVEVHAARIVIKLARKGERTTESKIKQCHTFRSLEKDQPETATRDHCTPSAGVRPSFWTRLALEVDRLRPTPARRDCYRRRCQCRAVAPVKNAACGRST